MNRCVKCGREIPAGELFCTACSLNPADSPLQEGPTSFFTASVGRMQKPKPVRQGQTAVAERPARKKSGGIGLKLALIAVSLLLAATLSFLFWQYESLRQERSRLEAKQADVLLREQEAEQLEAQVEELLRQREQMQEDLETQEQQLQELQNQLSGNQNSQGSYDYGELVRLEEENRQLLLLEQNLQTEIKQLTADLAAAQEFRTKAEFMDKYVVFGNNNNTGLYHTYDCPKFSKSSFWAYSRTLAEKSGFKPCPDCGGKP